MCGCEEKKEEKPCEEKEEKKEKCE